MEEEGVGSNAQTLRRSGRTRAECSAVENLDAKIGNLQSAALLNFFLEEIGPGLSTHAAAPGAGGDTLAARPAATPCGASPNAAMPSRESRR